MQGHKTLKNLINATLSFYAEALLQSLDSGPLNGSDVDSGQGLGHGLSPKSDLHERDLEHLFSWLQQTGPRKAVEMLRCARRQVYLGLPGILAWDNHLLTIMSCCKSITILIHSMV